MQGAVRIAAIATLVFLAGVAVAATDSGERASITVRLNPTRSGPEAAVWLGYPAARIGYIKDHESAYDWKPAVISPSFGGQCDRAIAVYEEAASAAEAGSDDRTKVTDLTRAWRGKAYCLVEQGHLDEAEQLYHKCLELDPNDSKAKNELKYIASKRRQARAAEWSPFA